MRRDRHSGLRRKALPLALAGLVGFALGSLVGCGEEEAPIRAATKTATPKSNAAAGPTSAGPTQTTGPTKTALTEFSYSSIGKRDPFRSYLADIQESQLSGATRKLEETEKFELDQYRLTGLVTATAQPKALVEDPAGKGHVLRLGSRLGKNGGRVTRITNHAIIVTEEFRDPTGQRVRVPITFKLPRPENDRLE